MKKINIFTDGGSRNNPGNAAVGVVINEHKFKKYIGVKTNNEAEYEGVILALTKLKELFSKTELANSEIILHLDSELVCKQINREYKVKDSKLQQLFLKVYNLKLELDNIKFKHIRRELNKLADTLVNEALDEKEGKI
jgi:ribonuclease HI